MLKSFGNETVTKTLVETDVLPASAAKVTASVDMGIVEQAQLRINAITDAADEVTTMSLEDSANDVDFVALNPVPVIEDIPVAQATYSQLVDIMHLRRYVRFKYTTVKSGTSFLCVTLGAVNKKA